MVRIRTQVIFPFSTVSGSTFTSVPSIRGVNADGAFKSGSSRTIAPFPSALIIAKTEVGSAVKTGVEVLDAVAVLVADGIVVGLTWTGVAVSIYCLGLDETGRAGLNHRESL